MISLRARAIRCLTRQYFKRLSANSDVRKMRTDFEAVGSSSKSARGVQIRHAKISGVDCEWLVPEGCDAAPLIYYLHGGAFAMGSPRTHRRMLSYIARKAGMRALLPDYRLAPEHPFPAALEDATDVYRSLIKDGNDADKIAIGGDSAGGNLAVATMLAVRDSGDALPVACFLMSPWLDLACQGDSFVTNVTRDPWFRVEDAPGIIAHYCSEFDTKNPLVSPVYGDATNLPPTLIQVGDIELLLSDSIRLADKLSAAGGDITLQVWPDMWHVFQYFIGRMPESKKAITDIAHFLRSEMPEADSSTAPGR